MKKILSFIVALFILLTSTSLVSAKTKEENRLYKGIVVSNVQLYKMYGQQKGKRTVKILDSFFGKLRGNKDVKKIQDIQNRVYKAILNLNKRNNLSYSEKRIKLLAENIYLRTKVLTDYILK